jgi:hypothetical protein
VRRSWALERDKAIEKAELPTTQRAGDPERIDKTFYDKYVAQATALEKYNKVKRFRTFSQGSMKQISMRTARHMRTVPAMGDKNLSCTVRMKDHYDLLLLAYGVVDRSLKEVAELKDTQTVSRGERAGTTCAELGRTEPDREAAQRL